MLIALRKSWLRWMLAPALRRAGAFGRDERGVTVIEFAILAVPFFTIIAAILETSLVFLASQVLDSAVEDAARLVRTGQLQTGVIAGDNLDGIRAKVCSGLYDMFDCDNLKIKLTVVVDFASATVTYPIEQGDECRKPDGTVRCDWKITPSYVSSPGEKVVLMQAYYKWPTLVRLPGFNLQDQSDGTRLLGAVRVFRNEPFKCTSCVDE
jgi:Flp pilus assembly protein TadG